MVIADRVDDKEIFKGQCCSCYGDANIVVKTGATIQITSHTRYCNACAFSLMHELGFAIDEEEVIDAEINDSDDGLADAGSVTRTIFECS